jgi:hypothetical protein
MAEFSNPIDEARRYVQNATEMIKSKGGLFEGLYLDSKYIRTAGHTAWCGVLHALEAIMIVKEPEKAKRVEFSDYLAAIPKREKVAKAKIESAYVILHLHMGYDGVKIKSVIDSGLKLAKEIIDWCDDYYTPPRQDVNISAKKPKKKTKTVRKSA